MRFLAFYLGIVTGSMFLVDSLNAQVQQLESNAQQRNAVVCTANPSYCK